MLLLITEDFGCPAHLSRPARHGLSGRDDAVSYIVASADPYIVRSRKAQAVSRRPRALPDALVYELHGLTEQEIRTVEGEDK
jgi:hypothetical protein